MDHPRGKLYIVSAPSGAGKTSLIAGLMEAMDNLVLSVSHTTRAMRPGEEEGVHYHFVDRTQFEQMVAQKLFLEHAIVFGHAYGTSKAVIVDQLSQGRDVLFEVDWQGARQIRAHFPEDVISIFVLPPSLDALVSRLTKRKQDSQGVIQQRMLLAQREIAHCTEYDYLIVNQDYAHALGQMQAIVQAQRLTYAPQAYKHRKTLQQLLAK